MIVIGRKDRIDLPKLGLFDIEAKIDTGAYGCVLHCHHMEVVERDGFEVLSFKVLDPNHPEYDNRVFYSKDFREKSVKNSSGVREQRYVIKTEVVIFNKSRRLEFSLTDRNTMKHPVLLGRKFLSKRYLVDVQLKDLSFQQKKR